MKILGECMDTFLGRQPILNEKEEILGFELLFRSDIKTNAAVVDDDVYASFKTLIDILQEFSIKDIAGDSLVFINANHDVLKSEAIELIPKDNFIIEILEHSVVDEELVERVNYLKNMGYTFALDDFVFDKDYLYNFMPLLNKISYIKVDITLNSIDKIKSKIGILKKTKAKLIAEKVETRQEFEQMKALGFDLYQGYYFAEPDILKTSTVEPSKVAVFKIINMLNNNSNIEEILNVFKVNPDLSYNLLKFINSVAFSFKNRIKSIRHAITILGETQLKRWLMVLSYIAKNKDLKKYPLFHVAIIRAKMMENLSPKVEQSLSRKETADAAFFIGILSLLPVALKVPYEDFINDLNLDDTVAQAIMHYKGGLGKLLEFVVASEQIDIPRISKLTQELSLSHSDISRVKLLSYTWLNKILNDIY